MLTTRATLKLTKGILDKVYYYNISSKNCRFSVKHIDFQL